MILQNLLTLKNRLEEVAEEVAALRDRTHAGETKDWYTTAEVAAMMGVTGYTVRVRWCCEGLIECQKDPESGKWRIPGREYERLRRGGRPAGL